MPFSDEISNRRNFAVMDEKAPKFLRTSCPLLALFSFFNKTKNV